ncbi:MAG: sulfatase, partial [Verrucomicrobiota bacterium]
MKIVGWIASLFLVLGVGEDVRSEKLPNIVFCMADDWSAPHAGALGDRTVKTPHFDRVAREGVLFPNAFVSTPSCTPSRLSILTGQHHWRLKEGDSLGGSLRKSFPVYTELLEAAGYRVGRYGKGVWPSQHTFRKRDSFGPRFPSFKAFLKEQPADKPFCFWYGGRDPHRPYELGVGPRSGIDPEQVEVPKCLPDHAEVRSDLADYYWYIERFDREVGVVLNQLKAKGLLEQTMVIVSGDNGMPFPRCKASLYDLGVRVPLAVRWGTDVAGGRIVHDFVSLCDFAPTFIDMAGLKPVSAMTGRSLLPVLRSKEAGRVDASRSFVLTGLEQHCHAWPARAIRTAEFLLIRNFEPHRWNPGTATGKNPVYDFAETPWPTGPGAFSYNVDPSPTKQLLRLNPEVKRYADLAFGTRPEFELYDLREDPDQLRNVADEEAYGAIRTRLADQLERGLIESGDPRVSP